MTDTSNPLLNRDYPIPFDRITPDDVVPAVTDVLERARERVDALGAGRGGGYAEVVGELDDIVESVERTWGPVSHLNNVASTPALREAYGEALPEITRFSSRLHHHAGLYRRLRDFTASPEGRALAGLRRRHLNRTLREFRRAGAELGEEDKESLEHLRVELSELGRRFEENLLDETAAFKKVVRDADDLAGLPETALERAAQLAAEHGEEGWLLTLDMPSVQAVLQHADDRTLRREIHTAYLDRCTSGDRDNAPIVTRILEIRRRLAEILGYPDFPDYRLEMLMAGSGGRVRGFLDQLIDRTRTFHERDTAELLDRSQRSGLGSLEPWDVSWLMEKLRRERFDVDDDMLRPWFPLDEVQAGLFEIASRLFGLSVERVDNPAVWHDEVRYFDVRDEGGGHLGSFYTDWFPRDTKRQGAWMDSLVSGGPAPNGSFQPHLAFIGGNFNPPTASRPALLTHREVCTLFHEFGHLLHHTCSRVEIPSRGGVNVAWDWVEVPSQIMENWCWEREALDLFARHHETGEALPDELLARLLAARRFMGGWLQMRQLSFANLDLELHRTYRGEIPVMDYAAAALRPFVPSARFVERHILPSFAHLFAGGYASAYYSYLWSETLEADAFSRFEGEGVLNPAVGRAFRDCILARGDSRDADELFRDFMGRDPDPGALIRRNLGSP
ncbi:MAG: M3 family metallopeptidase [Gemmatimonadetes bacterium]|nr:M3 family metallopeptidase [Gemmatimonadota bacterium]MYC92030.1 M3 family metallopeptidase [Gemmatimonadota bacterium]MYJ19076.1 M3 family metallopeptidase [Gemmatimonadota bacterium]